MTSTVTVSAAMEAALDDLCALVSEIRGWITRMRGATGEAVLGTYSIVSTLSQVVEGRRGRRQPGPFRELYASIQSKD